MSELIACIPNFSEARRPAVVQAIVEAMTHGKRTSGVAKTEELGEVGNRPSGQFTLDFH